MQGRPYEHDPVPNAKGKRIGVPEEFFGAGVDPRVAETVRAAIETLAACGAEIVPVSMPSMRYALAAYYVTCTSEASSNLARYDGVRYGPGGETAKPWHDAFTAVRSANFGDEVRRRILLGTFALSAGYYGKYYGKAQTARASVAADFARLFREVDVLAGPTMPTVAFTARRARRPALDVPRRRPDRPREPRGRPRHLGPVRHGRRPPRRAPADGPALRRRGRHRSCGRVPGGGGRMTDVIIGLEVHCQLDTQTKLFCACSTDYRDDGPNTHVCPVCLGLPGTMPAVNRAAIEYALKVAKAFHCEIPEECEFSRKNYFYPDLPKGYRITQYDRPLALGGYIEIEGEEGGEKRVRLTRIHVEEDPGRLVHKGNADRGRYSLVDYNRSGVPLIEIVTEPDMPLAQGGAAPPRPAPRDPRVPRRLRLREGGLAPRGRERLDPGPRAGRGQEHLVVPGASRRP